jgi:guanylate kinase
LKAANFRLEFDLAPSEKIRWTAQANAERNPGADGLKFTKEGPLASFWPVIGMTDFPQPLLRRGICLILSSPSGAGKTTLARSLMQADSNLAHSISVTTREARPQERDGEDYFFVSRERFEALRASGALLEWAEVFGNLYGTPKEPVQRMLAEGRDIIFDVDWQGAGSIAACLPEDAVRVFILPPSAGELARRIHARAADSLPVIDARLKAAAAEIAHWVEYDYVIVNHHIEESLAVLKAILLAERHRRHRQTGLGGLARSLSHASSSDVQHATDPQA